jgi:hypothetical protein
MRQLLAGIFVACACAGASFAQVSIGIATPGVSIGIQLPMYPKLVAVPGYPVYYAPGLNTNYFFYDGMYWVYQGNHWYASTWYNGPWSLVPPLYVPVYVLRVPVRYYRMPPPYFHPWRAEAPPRWGEYWGDDWQRQRPGWDKWNRQAVPAPAPLPVHQRKYTGERYPYQVERQQALNAQSYGYRPKDAMVREQYSAQAQGKSPARGPQGGPPSRQASLPQKPAQGPQASPPQQKGPPPGRGNDQGGNGHGRGQGGGKPQ